MEAAIAVLEHYGAHAEAIFVLALGVLAWRSIRAMVDKYIDDNDKAIEKLEEKYETLHREMWTAESHRDFEARLTAERTESNRRLEDRVSSLEKSIRDMPVQIASLIGAKGGN